MRKLNCCGCLGSRLQLAVFVSRLGRSMAGPEKSGRDKLHLGLQNPHSCGCPGPTCSVILGEPYLFNDGQAMDQSCVFTHVCIDTEIMSTHELETRDGPVIIEPLYLEWIRQEDLLAMNSSWEQLIYLQLDCFGKDSSRNLVQTAAPRRFCCACLVEPHTWDCFRGAWLRP